MIFEKEPTYAPLLARQLELAGLASSVSSKWPISPDSTAVLPPMMVFMIQDQTVPLHTVWAQRRTIREHTDIPISILLMGIEPSDCLVDISIGGSDLRALSLDHTATIANAPDSIQKRTDSMTRKSILRRHGDLLLDPECHQVMRDGRTFQLTPSECKILNVLMEWPGCVFQRDELIRVLYREHEVVVPRVIDVHISHLRKKIEPDQTCPIYILSVRGVGYQFAHAGP